MTTFDYWQFLAGLAIFLLGLYFLEQSLKTLAGRSFKKYLRKHTTNPLKGILAGAGITAVLQSSTIVSLMMIAFVGAGILTLNNAIGVIFGSNLGTTITGWLVVLLGFEIDIATFALPLVAIGGLIIAFFRKAERLSEVGRGILGFGFLFVGLAFMKESVEALQANFDVGIFTGLHPYVFFPAGLVMAAIINSSSGVMVIGLSALSAGIIPLEAAAALAVGADLGTTSTAILGSLNGTAPQKQVAASHFLFNLITDCIALILLYPLLRFITGTLGFENPLFTLVAFHTIFNLLGIVLLFPFIHVLAAFLRRRFQTGTVLTKHISRVATDIPEAAIEALHQELHILANKVLALNVEGLRIQEGLFASDHNSDRLFKPGGYLEHYEEMKQHHGEMMKFFLRIHSEKLDTEESLAMTQYTHALKHLLKAAKSVKDVSHDIQAYESSSNDAKYALYQLLKGKANALYLELYRLLHATSHTSTFELLAGYSRQNHTDYDTILKETYHQVMAGQLSEIEIATFLNTNREIHSANKSMIAALSDILLTPREADDFDKIPEMA